MRAKVTIDATGKVSVFVERDAGDYATAKAKVEALLDSLKAQGVVFEVVGNVERHVHGDEVAHAHGTQTHTHD